MVGKKTYDRISQASIQPMALKAGGAVGRLVGRTIAGGLEAARPVGSWLGALTAPRIPFHFISFLLLVILPSIASTVYLAWIASDQYVAETRFAVRNSPSSRGITDDLKSLISTSAVTGSMSLTSQDAFIVVQYVRSRTAIEDVMKTVDLRAVYTHPTADFWARLPRRASVEDLTDYWREMVYANVDAPSGIVSLFVRAFTPQDARAVSEALLASIDRLVNALSERARQDALEKAEIEVRAAEGKVRKALQDLRELRDREGMLDPGIAATGASELLLKTLGERIRFQSELTVASQRLHPNSPTINTLRAQIDAIDAQIVALRAEMTSKSANNPTISSFLVRFEELEIQRIFSEKMYGLAQNALERARLKAEQKQVYLSVFVPPGTPQDSKYPERLNFGVILPLIFLIIWGVVALVWAAVEDHRI